MCLAVPGKLLETQVISDNRLGVVEFGGIKRSVFLDFVPEAEVGDYVMVHVGFAISRIDEQEAQRTFELLERIGMLETADDAPPETEEPAGAATTGGPDAIPR
ncbi:MAG TPA: HypC/HybG/HupF family hydrogenase formation chaperone [Bryobacteraceae bacterium]|nr:HypC/HybG/HupF family hydrogenase formation chaperone [Bryobacteraceae bacterium]